MMRLSDIDTNLLVLFDLIYRKRNLQQVAEHQGITQPAVSHGLKRLRLLMADELFERTSTGLVPTAFATRLHPPVAESLRQLQESLNLPRDFDPAHSDRHFTISMTDIGEIVFLPRLMHQLELEAPAVSIETVRGHDLKRRMEEGRIDLAAGLIPQLGAGFFQRRLFLQHYVCLMRKEHPLAYGDITISDFRNAQHAVIDAQGTGHDRLEDRLIKEGIQAPLTLRMPHFVTAPFVISSTDMIVTVTNKLADATAERFGLVARPHPLKFAELPINMFWHRRFHKDPANQWLRGLFHRLFAESDNDEEGDEP
ncbi:LysR family transcriptional regulator [Halomonas sp. V046]|uniref:LysR family transcriptional regulator n=1 Tax=Halomonas sp. V046 TaxID=3459611 RepID=UPI0040447B73